MSTDTDVSNWLRELYTDGEHANIAEHLGSCRDRGCTPDTIRSKLIVLRRAQRELHCDLVDVAEPKMRRWWRNLSTRGWSPSTRATNLRHLRVFYRWAIREELREDDPTRRLDAPRVPRGMPHPANLAAVHDLLQAIDGSMWIAVSMATFVGLRCAEITRVRPCDVQRDGDDDDHDHAALRVPGKGGRVRVVPLVPELSRQLAKLPQDRPAVVSPRYGTPYTPNGLSHALAELLREYGVNGTAHSLRHLYATRVHRAGRDLLSTQRLLGHVSPDTTAVYAEVDAEVLRAAAEAAWADLGADGEKPLRPHPPRSREDVQPDGPNPIS